MRIDTIPAPRCLALALACMLAAGAAHAQSAAGDTVTAQQSPPAQAEKQQRAVDVGRREFEANCASCHGRVGKG